MKHYKDLTWQWCLNKSKPALERSKRDNAWGQSVSVKLLHIVCLLTHVIGLVLACPLICTLSPQNYDGPTFKIQERKMREKIVISHIIIFYICLSYIVFVHNCILVGCLYGNSERLTSFTLKFVLLVSINLNSLHKER